MRYEGNIYRPPSEAYSLIIQATIGCAHNECTFCSMFKDKKFRIRNVLDVIADLEAARKHYRFVEKIFLADGDALVLRNADLVHILECIRRIFPECSRVGIYASPQDVLRKTPEELRELHKNGLGIAYMGVESGSAEILTAIKKGVTPEQMVEAGRKLEDSGIKASVTFISGIGGKEKWREHAVETGKVISLMQPSYIGLLTLMVEPGTELYDDIQAGRFILLSPEEILAETHEMIQNIDVKKRCVFRSNHASNYLSLRGDLPQDKARLLAQIEKAMEDSSMLKEERFRML